MGNKTTKLINELDFLFAEGEKSSVARSLALFGFEHEDGIFVSSFVLSAHVLRLVTIGVNVVSVKGPSLWRDEERVPRMLSDFHCRNVFERERTKLLASLQHLLTKKLNQPKKRDRETEIRNKR